MMYSSPRGATIASEGFTPLSLLAARQRDAASLPVNTRPAARPPCTARQVALVLQDAYELAMTVPRVMVTNGPNGPKRA